MSLVAVATSTPVPHANARLVDSEALQRELESQIEGEVRFDAVSRALYSTDASVYQIQPLGVVVAKSREDLIRIVRIASRFRCPITLRGGGTAQAGQSIGAGLQVDTSKYYNQILELNARRALGSRPAGHRARRIERRTCARTGCASRRMFPPPAAPPSAA